jgi:hypothetical protein
MWHARAQSNDRQRQAWIAAAVFALSILPVPFVLGAGQMTDLSARSKSELSPALEFDIKAKLAFQARALPDLQSLYTDLKARNAAVEEHTNSGGDACGCDVAMANLLIIVGFAINKLDGGGRYEPWMLDESLNLMDDYTSYMADCAADADAAPAQTELTAQLVKAL